MMNSEHSLYAPSSSERWLRCPGSVIVCQELEDESGDEANEGTYLHQKAEVCARYGISPFDLIGETVTLGEKPYEFSYDNALWLDIGLSWLEDRIRDADYVSFEEKIPTFFDQFGSTDVAAYNVLNKELTIFDWKFGYYGIRTKDNTQLGIYTVGHIKKLNDNGFHVHKVTLAICQPKIDHQVEEETYESLEWFYNLREQAEAVYGSNKLVAGAEQCMFCPAKFFCTEYRNHVMELIDLMVDNAGKHQNLSDEDVQKVIVNKKLITDFLKRVEEEALHRLDSGVEFKEIDLVTGKKPAAEWTKGEGEIVSHFTENTTLRESELFNLTLKTPAQVLALLGKAQPDKVKLVADISVRGKTPKRVVPRFGKGERTGSVADMFNDF